jgi:hypothetical protein
MGNINVITINSISKKPAIVTAYRVVWFFLKNCLYSAHIVGSHTLFEGDRNL